MKHSTESETMDIIDFALLIDDHLTNIQTLITGYVVLVDGFPVAGEVTVSEIVLL